MDDAARMEEHNREVEVILNNGFEAPDFVESVQSYMTNQGLSRYAAEIRAVNEHRALKQLREFLQNDKGREMKAQRQREIENGTFRTVAAPQTKAATINSVEPEQIPVDFGLPDKDTFNGADIQRCAARMGYRRSQIGRRAPPEAPLREARNSI